jgi:hypothetical protein
MTRSSCRKEMISSTMVDLLETGLDNKRFVRDAFVGRLFYLPQRILEVMHTE